MRLQNDKEFKNGYNSITELAGKHSKMLMDFGVLKLSEKQEFSDDAKLEKLYVLLYGEIEILCDGKTYTAKRKDYFTDEVFTLDVPMTKSVKIIGIAKDSEVIVIRTENTRDFEVKVRNSENSTFETRGQATLNGAAERIVKTMQDHRIAPESNIMLGEDVHYPGKWSGFPSHSHNQPEIYFYKFLPDNGFGLLKLGDEGVLLEHNNAILIDPDLVHPQVTAPGYAMYYLWVIRHLDGNPYLGPTMEEQHRWSEKPGAKYWPDLQADL